MPRMPVRGAVVKTVHRTLHIVLVAVWISQGLALAPDILNLLHAKGEIETLMVALQIVRGVAGSNADKLMGQNTGSSVEIGSFSLIRFATVALMPSVSPRIPLPDNRNTVVLLALYIIKRHSLTKKIMSSKKPLTAAEESASFLDSESSRMTSGIALRCISDKLSTMPTMLLILRMRRFGVRRWLHSSKSYPCKD